MRIIRYYPRALAGDGGITMSVHSSARAMARLGARVSVLYEPTASTVSPPPADGVAWLPVRHHGVSALRRPTGLAELLEGADILVLHSAWTGHNLAAAAEARRLGVPYVLEPRGAYDPCIVRRRYLTKRVWWECAERRMVQGSVAVHVFFLSERQHLARLGYEGPAVVAPNGVQIPDGHRWDGGTGQYLLWLGRFDPEHKGLDLLLDAMAMLPSHKRPFLRLHGPDWRGRKHDVAEMVKTRGLNESVMIGSAVHGEEKFALMARARAFVYPSRWEAFGNSVAEAAAVGVPILTTRYPLGVFLEERSAAVACAPTPSRLASGIEEILDPAAAKLGTQARALVESEFSWNTVAKSWLEQVEVLL
jgi:glycosyltransferase involved in cell wall biosynthesis